MSANNNKKAIELLFERPLEPVFTSRDNGKAVFDLPDSYIVDEYTDVKEGILSRFAENVETRIPLRELGVKPNLAFTKPLDKRRTFSLFNELHQSIASQLIKIFMDAPSEEAFIQTCAYTKDRVNAFLFQYCYAVAVQHRPDTKNFPVRPIAELFPKNFVEPAVFQDARAEGEIVQNSGDRRHIMIPHNYTASDREEEQRLGYFREDIGVNSHHWHWHLVYPGSGPTEVVAKDRRGELFYYMHHQLIARYNVERFCNNLPRVKPLNNLRDPIPEGYYPKLLSSLNNRTYPGRKPDITLQDVAREGSELELADIQRWTDRITQAIDQGYVTNTNGQNIPLDGVKGIDYLGDLVEATSLSVNRDVYGNLHNMGHNAISLSHDPDYRFLEEPGVMGDVTTAMRDPIFYRWHSYIDGIFNRHKAKLAPYTSADIGYDGISVVQCSVKIINQSAKANTLLTYWEHSDVDLAAGLDFGPIGNIYASFQHLQHAPFEFNIKATNNSGANKLGTCRIFLCPKADERNVDLTLNEQRMLAIEMDKFTVTLRPGENTIRHNSHESSVTIPYERSFRRVGEKSKPDDEAELATFNFCGCGWPEHMFLPKGKPEGMKFDLFVMISDYNGDAVQEPNNSVEACADSASFCGLKDKLYPDKRSMGYPFDRRLPGDNLKALTDAHSNMQKTEISIIFKNLVVERPKL